MNPTEIVIYDQIGTDFFSGDGVGAKAFSQQLKAIPNDREITVRINSPGGNVWDGLAIYNLLSARRDKVVTIIDGIALSIASVIALAGREVHMPKAALFMAHDPYTITIGDADEMRQAADTLDVHKAAIVAAYQRKTGKTVEELNAMMTAETWFTGEEAKAYGFVDVLIEGEPVQNSFNLSGFKHVPKALSTQPRASQAARNSALKIFANSPLDNHTPIHMPAIVAPRNANTIDANLQRTTFLKTAMRAFKRRVLAVNAFSTVFRDVALEGTDKVVVPFYPRFTTASADFVQGDGYTFGGVSTTNSKEVTINKRKYQSIKFNSAEMRRQPALKIDELAAQQGEQLAVDVLDDILSVVTAANFGAPVLTETADLFTLPDIADLNEYCETNDWPEQGRALVLDTTYRGNIAKELLNVSGAGTDETLRRGSIGRLLNFDIFSSPRIPTNAENLKGFICTPDCVLVAFSPIEPAEGVMKQLLAYEKVTDADTGLTLEYRRWGSAQLDEAYEVIECNYGYALGNADSLKRITSA